MAKNTNPTGVYAPLSFRARRLITQLRRATHRAVQNAIIQELIHEMQKGSRRVRKQSAFFRAAVKKQSRQAAGKAGTALRKRAAAAVQKARAPRMRCTCGQTFRSKLLFAAHARSHSREKTMTPRGRRAGQQAAGRAYRAPRATINTGIIPSRAPIVRPKAEAHARDVITAAGPRGRAAQAAARTAAASGQPLGRGDLKNLAKQTRTAPPPRQAAKPARVHANLAPMDPIALKAAREAPLPHARSRQLAILRRDLRNNGPVTRPARTTRGAKPRPVTPAAAPARTPKAAPALRLAPTARAPRTTPARPGRTT